MHVHIMDRKSYWEENVRDRFIHTRNVVCAEFLELNPETRRRFLIGLMKVLERLLSEHINNDDTLMVWE